MGDLLGRGLTARGDDQQLGVFQARVLENLGIGGVAHQYLEPCGLRLLGAVQIALNHQAGNVQIRKDVRHAAARLAVAHHDHVTLHTLGRRLELRRMALVEPHESRMASHGALERRHALEHKGVQGDGHHGAAQNQAVLVGREHAQRHARLTDEERELADLRETGADGQAFAQTGGEQHA